MVIFKERFIWCKLMTEDNPECEHNIDNIFELQKTFPNYTAILAKKEHTESERKV